MDKELDYLIDGFLDYLKKTGGWKWHREGVSAFMDAVIRRTQRNCAEILREEANKYPVFTICRRILNEQADKLRDLGEVNADFKKEIK